MVVGTVVERGTHIAHAGGLVHVIGGLHVVLERVAWQAKVLARFKGQGFVLQ